MVGLSIFRRTVHTVQLFRDEAGTNTDRWNITAGLLQKVGSALRDSGAKHCRVDVTLSDDYGRYFSLKAGRGKFHRHAAARLAELQFRKQFGAPAEPWTLQCDIGGRGDGVACALPSSVLQSIHVLQAQAGCRIGSIRPALIRSMNERFVRETQAIISVGRDVLAFAIFRNGVWDQVWSQYYSTNDISEGVNRIIDREFILRGVGAGMSRRILNAGASQAAKISSSNNRVAVKFKFRSPSPSADDPLVGLALAGAM